jgi:hypothetical protein
MEPNDDKRKRVLPAVGVLTTFIYEGPITRPRRSFSTATNPEGNDKAQEHLTLVDGVSSIVTFVIEKDTGRLFRKE